MSLLLPLVVSALLFAIGVYGVLARRNAVLVLMGVELMLNAVNLNLVAFDAYLRDVVHAGQVLTLFVIALAAAEIGLGLAIVLMVFRSHRHIDVDRLRDLSDSDAADEAIARDARAERDVSGSAPERRPDAVETDDGVEQVGSHR